MLPLTDPRTIDTRPCPALLAPLVAHKRADEPALARLSGEVAALLAAGEEAAVQQLLDWRGPPWLNRAVRRCVQSALEASPNDPLRLQFFLLPVVLITGSRAPSVLPMVLADAGSLTELFQAAGAAGPARQLAFNANLCDEAALTRLPLADLYRRARLAGDIDAPLDLPAAPLPVAAGQSVALRFLAGTTLVARGAPGFNETAGDAARWGAALTRELTGQLALPGVTLLPLARPPRGLLPAMSLGRFCHQEAACQLALGDHLRDLRARGGEARAHLRADVDGAVDITLRALWGDDTRAHRWVLDAESDFGEVLDSLTGFLTECGVTAVAGEDVRLPGPAH